MSDYGTFKRKMCKNSDKSTLVKVRKMSFHFSNSTNNSQKQQGMERLNGTEEEKKEEEFLFVTHNHAK